MKSTSVSFILLALLLAPELSLGAKVQMTNKSLKEATHFELAGPSDWRYDVSKANKNGGLVVSVQFSGVKVEDLQSFENFRDKRVQQVVVKEGLNKDALVEFYIANQMSFFDYQADTSLVFDIYKDIPKTAAVVPVTKAAKTKKTVLPKELKSFASTKGGDRRVASLERPELGKQVPLLTAEKGDTGSQEYLDNADKNYKRFSLPEGPSAEQLQKEALMRSEKEIYPPFPELIKEITPSLADLDNSNKVVFDLPAQKNEENQIVRLMIRLVGEEKYAVALRTLKFFRDKYPTSQYDETVSLLKAETYFRLWKKDKKLSDFDTALGLYKEHLNNYPQSQYKNKILYFIGMSYFENGQYVESLGHFQEALKNNPDSPYYWPMRMAVAESYRALRQEESALSELTAIERDPRSANFAVQARFRRGDVYFKIGNYPAAIEEYAKAIKMNPGNSPESANAYFNTAEANFRMKDYKKALENFKIFIQKFPEHAHGSYAMNRVATLLEILGAPQDRVLAAYLESYYRYRGSPGSYLSKLKVNLARFDSMKPKEVEAVVKEATAEIPVGKVDQIDTLLKLSLADGYLKRGETQKSLDIYTRFYKENLNSEHLPLFKDRIFKAIHTQMNEEMTKDSMTVIQTWLKNKDTWLKGNTRVDTEVTLAKAYEKLNLLDDAATHYENAEKKMKALSAEDEARRCLFEDALSADSLHLRLAKVTLNSEELKKSAEYIASIKHPENLSGEEKVEYSMIMAEVSEKEGRYDMAINQLKNLTSAWKGKPNLLIGPYVRISKLYDDQKNKPETRAQALLWSDKVLELVNSSKNPAEDFNMDTVRDSLRFAADLNYRHGNGDKAIQIYKSLLEKYADSKVPTASLKYKLGKIYFDRGNVKEAEKTWGELKADSDGALWAKMAEENILQSKWSDKFKRYVGRKPASASGESK